jgi:MFS family permease
MYSIDWEKIFSRKPRVDSAPIGANGEDPGKPRKTAGWRGWLPVVSQTVWALGVTSLLTDISSEMIASILPLYLVLQLGMSPLAFGLVDGIYQGAAALVRVAGGVISDRWRKHKEVAAVGYGLSAACRLLILAAGSAWGTIAAIVTLDRIGKGIRTAPRDALISASTPKAELATAFGVHRALDAAGAMLGPVVAFLILTAMPGSFDVVFIASFGVAIIGLAAIALFVPATRRGPAPVGVPAASLASAAALLRDARFRRLLGAGTLLGLATISDSFLFLTLQKRISLGLTAFPLYYVATSLVTSMFAVTCGRLADRIGRKPVLLCGYALLAVLYATLWLPGLGGWSLAVVVVALLGLYYAATDGVLTAMVAAILPAASTGSGLAIFATATNAARLLASVAFGYLWGRAGAGSATCIYLVALGVAMAVAAILLKTASSHEHRPSPASQ